MVSKTFFIQKRYGVQVGSLKSVDNFNFTITRFLYARDSSSYKFIIYTDLFMGKTGQHPEGIAEDTQPG
jgi:hypothetical protein